MKVIDYYDYIQTPEMFLKLSSRSVEKIKQWLDVDISRMIANL